MLSVWRWVPLPHGQNQVRRPLSAHDLRAVPTVELGMAAAELWARKRLLGARPHQRQIMNVAEEWAKSQDPKKMMSWLLDETKTWQSMSPSKLFGCSLPKLHECLTYRKGRLFAVACCRRVWNRLLPSERAALEVAERMANGEATDAELWAAFNYDELGSDGQDAEMTVCVHYAASNSSWGGDFCAQYTLDNALYHAYLRNDKAEGDLSNLLREVFGNPFVEQSFGWKDDVWFGDWCLTSNVLHLAQIIYDGELCSKCVNGKVFVNEGHPILPETTAVCAYCSGTGHVSCFERMPILADAMEDAGCMDQSILSHCRGNTTHVRGCHVLDQILGKL